MFPRLFDIERLIHSFKTAIACLIGILLTKIIGFPADQWVVVTIIVVMCAQIYVGSVMQKAYLRFLGTLLGCIIAMSAIVMLGDTSLSAAITISLASFVFSYFAVGQEMFSYSATLGAVTTAIIMMGHSPSLTLAAERFLEISVGLLIATLVSQFILPIHARNHLRRAQARTLEQIREYYSVAIMSDNTAGINHHELDENIAKTIIKQRQLAKECGPEPLGLRFDSAQFMQTLYYEREILRATTFMHIALTHIFHTQNKNLTNSNTFNHFNQHILEALTILIKSLWAKADYKESVYFPDLTKLKNETSNIIPAANEDRIYIDGLIFSAEILTNSLEKLARLYQISIAEAV